MQIYIQLYKNVFSNTILALILKAEGRSLESNQRDQPHWAASSGISCKDEATQWNATPEMQWKLENFAYLLSLAMLERDFLYVETKMMCSKCLWYFRMWK